MRIENNGIRYFGFQEYASAYGVKPVTKTKKDKERFESQREKFIKRHKCRGCGRPLVYIDETNVMICTNPGCRGIKVERENKDGEKMVSYLPSYDVLDEYGTEIAKNI